MTTKLIENSKVAVFWYIDDKDKFIGPEMDYRDAVYYGDYGQCDDDHFSVWSKYRRDERLVGGYDYYPRGRVMFNSRIHKFVVVCDKCIVNNADIRRKLRYWYNLPETTIFSSDEHYSCHNCRR